MDAHPGLADIANNVFTNAFEIDSTNQLHVLREDDQITQTDLIEPCEGSFTEECFRTNIRVTLRYIEAWLRGVGCVPIYGLMEDAATAEISRSQLWQWIKNEAKTDVNKSIDKSFVTELIEDEVNKIKEIQENSEMLSEAVTLFSDLILMKILKNF